VTRLFALILTLSALVVAGCGGGGSSGAGSTGTSAATTTTSTSGGVQLGPSFGSFASLPGTLRTPPPWGPNDGAPLKPRLVAMGLKPLGQEGTVIHIHQHLDLYVDGNKVTVPALIGISEAGGFLSDLHTHDTSGVMHVESSTPSSYSLGQFFGVWGLQLTPQSLGSLHTGGGRILDAWVNGKPVTADPTRIVLQSHQEIVLAYGTKAQMPKHVPASYAFPAGL
jgi:hypothetical protein